MRISEVPEYHKKNDILYIPSTTTVSKASKEMARKNIGAVPVVDHGQLVGILSERDVMKRVVAEGLDPEKTQVSAVMTKNPKTAHPDDWITSAIAEMVHGGFRHLPIVDKHGKLTGFLSQRDFMSTTLTGLIKRDAKYTLLTLSKAPEVWILLTGFALYTLMMMWLL